MAGISLGLMLAARDTILNPWLAFFICLTAIFLQILSNVANEYGDFLKGTDRLEDRQGPAYTLSSGLLSKKGYKRMILGYIALSALSGLSMICLAFSSLFTLPAIFAIILGLLAIYAALNYTLGSKPYGYSGLGDLFVFLFFGLAAVLGSYFIACQKFPPLIMLLPASSVGFLAVAVLNVNNIRDRLSDSLTRKTIAVRLGDRRAKIYHMLLLLLGWFSMIVYAVIIESSSCTWWNFLFLLIIPLYIVHWTKVRKNSGRKLDKQLPLLVMGNFLFSLLAGIGFLLSV